VYIKYVHVNIIIRESPCLGFEWGGFNPFTLQHCVVCYRSRLGLYYSCYL